MLVGDRQVDKEKISDLAYMTTPDKQRIPYSSKDAVGTLGYAACGSREKGAHSWCSEMHIG